MAAAHDDTENLDAPRFTFDDFWRAYPRRVARKSAEQAWRKIDPAEHHKIFAALPGHKSNPDWKRESGKFIPYPASWLNGERWLDEMEADLSMGQCHWNINGNRNGEVRCADKATMEKHGNVYCKTHGERN